MLFMAVLKRQPRSEAPGRNNKKRKAVSFQHKKGGNGAHSLVWEGYVKNTHGIYLVATHTLFEMANLFLNFQLKRGLFYEVINKMHQTCLSEKNVFFWCGLRTAKIIWPYFIKNLIKWNSEVRISCFLCISLKNFKNSAF